MEREAKKAEREIENRISTFFLRLVLVPVFLVVFGLGIWWVIHKNANDSGSPKGAEAASWDGKSTFECKGNDAVTLSGQTVETTASPAIRAAANCQLTLTNMNITAPIVIEAKANAQVTIKGGSLTGSDKSIVAAASADVVVEGATVSGATDASGAATITGVP